MTRHDKIKILPTMERASKLIRRLSGDVITPEQLCCAAWPEAVGKKISAHTRPAKLVRNRLVVEVEDHTWQRQLFALTPHILNNLEKTLGRGLVEDLEFRIVAGDLQSERFAVLTVAALIVTAPARPRAWAVGEASPYRRRARRPAGRSAVRRAPADARGR